MDREVAINAPEGRNAEASSLREGEEGHQPGNSWWWDLPGEEEELCSISLNWSSNYICKRMVGCLHFIGSSSNNMEISKSLSISFISQ